MKYLPVLLILAACGHRDPAFDTYVARFEAASVEYGNAQRVSTAIEFAPQDKGIVARCDHGRVGVDPTAWDGLSDVGRERILFHELGHCVLDKGHSTNPFSIMYAYPHTVYEHSREADLKELFQ